MNSQPTKQVQGRPNFLITGCGRSGTGSLADILSASGIRCGHEVKYSVYGPAESEGGVSESSWYAAPFIKDLPRNTKIIHVIRNPISVVASFYRIGLCERSGWKHFSYGRSLLYVLYLRKLNMSGYVERASFVRAHRTLLGRYTNCMNHSNEVDRLWAYWGEWNELVERTAQSANLSYLRVKIEDLEESLPSIAGFLGLSSAPLVRQPSNLKLNYPPREVPWTPMPKDIRVLAHRYGYSDQDLERNSVGFALN